MPRAASRAWSRATWYGRIRGQASEMKRRSRTGTPRSSRPDISLINASGESTTPLPMMHFTLLRRIPDGIKWRTVF
ncbi:Uncharacterised protein [Vibrio cholerae]|nr:Uncharacterised protein [Vibrio cholerae]CSI69334.1 Uncharacterised protein [Vibrio cholerae]